jgi:hypothetical protein
MKLKWMKIFLSNDDLQDFLKHGERHDEEEMDLLSAPSDLNKEKLDQ